jgi:hypothetical protein
MEPPSNPVRFTARVCTVSVDLYLSPHERLSRADVCDELEERLPPGCEVVGAGGGSGVSNIDLEIPDRTALPAIVELLRSIGVRGDTILALSDTAEQLPLSDFPFAG